MDVDTIASVSTAPGVGAIAIVRVSGPAALSVLQRIVPTRTERPETRRANLVELRDPDDGSALDRAVATYFEGPASYTGEDMVEFSCHGGWLIPGRSSFIRLNATATTQYLTCVFELEI